MVNEVRTECEVNAREAIDKLRVYHEVRNLHMYYNSKINELNLNHGVGNRRSRYTIFVDYINIL